MSKLSKVFVYGTLLKGFGNHRLMSTSKYLGNATLEGFDMFSLGAFPVISPGKGRIAVELYEVDEGVMSSLDRLEGYPTFYNRMKVDIPGQEDQAWIYFMENPQENYGKYRGGQLEKVESGSWKAYRFPTMSANRDVVM